MLDDYSILLLPEIRAALLKSGYVLVVIGGKVTGDIQVNDADIHRLLKPNYRKLEQELVMREPSDNPLKIPEPSRDDIMRMLDESFESLQIDFSNRYKEVSQRTCKTTNSTCIVCIGVSNSPPQKKNPRQTPPIFFAKLPFKSANCPSPLFRQCPYILFLKIRFSILNPIPSFKSN